MHTFPVAQQKIVVAKWIGYLALIDLLVFPYFQLLIVPYSLPLIMFGFICLDVRIKQDYYLLLYMTIAGAVLVSLVISIFLPPYSEYMVDNFKYAFQLLTSFLYFFYFRWLATRIQLNIAPILMIFVAWFVLLGILFLNAPLDSDTLITSIYGRLVKSEDIILGDFRFRYIFSDPNTAIYFFLIALAPLLMSAKNIYLLLLFLIAGALMVLLTQSSGGLSAYALMVFALLFYRTNNMKSLMSFKNIFIVLVVVVVFLCLYFYFMDLMQDNIVVDFAIKRLSGEDDRLSGGGGRFKHWSALYNNFMPLPFGRGYTLYNEGYIEPPHSDFFGLLYRYGFVALIPSLLFIFGKYRKVVPLLIPAAVTFAINSLLDEQKLFALFLSLLAIGATVTPSQKECHNQILQKELFYEPE